MDAGTREMYVFHVVSMMLLALKIDFDLKERAKRFEE
jgi:hypothetical protein